MRPMTPMASPIVGATLIPNLFLNTGHGTLGWTMSAGSGAGRGPDLGTTPDIAADDLGYAQLSARCGAQNRRAANPPAPGAGPIADPAATPGTPVFVCRTGPLGAARLVPLMPKTIRQQSGNEFSPIPGLPLTAAALKTLICC